MKLELKHLAPYLPYGLKVSSIHTLNAENGIGNINHIVRAVNKGKKQYRPILRPLSDLTKEEYRCLFYGNPLDYKIDELPYKTFIKLLEWHFDVFHLIPQGLAIDINTLQLA